MPAAGQPARVGLDVLHGVPEPFVIAVHLVDDLLRTADQGRAALDEVLQRLEDHRQARPLLERQIALEDGPVDLQRLLGRGGHVQARRARTDGDVRRVVAVVLPALPVVPDQLGVGLDGVGDVRREQRVAVAGGQVHRLLAGGAAVPDPDRLLVRPRPRLGILQRRAEAGVGGDLVLPPQPPEHLVALGVAVPLVLGCDLEQFPLGRAVALADDQVQAAVGEVVQCRVVLVGPDRVQQAECRHGGEEPDAPGQCGDVAQDHRRRGGEERPLVPLPHTEPVEAELLGQHCVVQDLAEAVVRGLLDTGDRVGPVHDEGDREELHDAARSDEPAERASGWARPRWSRRVVPS